MPVTYPGVSDRNFTPSSTALGSFHEATLGEVEALQMLHGQLTGVTELEAAEAGPVPTALVAVTVTPSAPITAGDRLVVLIGVWNDNGPSTISVVDSAGNAYVKLTQFEASDKTEMSVWTAPITQGGGTTPTVTATPSGSADLGIQVLEYSGLSQVADATVVDQLSTATGSTESTPVTVRSGDTAATTAANELALGFYLDSGFGATLAAGAGFTLRGNISPSADMEFLAEDEMAMLGGSPNAGVATRGGVTWLMATVVLKHA